MVIERHFKAIVAWRLSTASYSFSAYMLFPVLFVIITL